jgi:hypothetical protein
MARKTDAWSIVSEAVLRLIDHRAVPEGDLLNILSDENLPGLAVSECRVHSEQNMSSRLSAIAMAILVKSLRDGET